MNTGDSTGRKGALRHVHTAHMAGELPRPLCTAHMTWAAPQHVHSAHVAWAMVSISDHLKTHVSARLTAAIQLAFILDPVPPRFRGVPARDERSD